MTSQIIYHDFQRNTSPLPAAAPKVVLNRRVLKKGRQHFKTVARVNSLINGICYFFCGACAGFSIFVLLLLCVWC